jgi:4-amino-4-deoxy-L-arabinose transferase-like glycosyltransferase
MPANAWRLAVGAIVLRAAAALMVVVIDSDGARDLRMAGLLEQGRFAEALTVPPPTPPLHAFLSALANLAVGNLLISGVAVSVLLGGLALLPLYAMVLRIWDERVATVAGALYACLPALVDIHAEAMTEGTFMFFFLGAMALGWSALEERSWERTVAAAGCSVLAWLARPEGVYLLPLFLAAAALGRSRFAPLAIAIFLATGIVLAFPYLSFIHARSGHWQSSLSPIPGMIRDFLAGRRAAGSGTQDFEEYRVVREHGIVLGGARLLGSNLFGKVLFYALGPFVVLGCFRARPAEQGRRLLAFLLLAAVGYLVPVALSFAAATPFSHRFLLVPATLLLPLAAVGLIRAAEWTRRRRAIEIAVGTLCLVMIVRDLRPRRADKAGMKEAGLAILQTLGPGRRVFATHPQIEFYARGEYLGLPEGAGAELLLSSGIDAFAFCAPDLRLWEPRLEERIREKTAYLGEFPSPPRRNALPVRVYLSRR